MPQFFRWGKRLAFLAGEYIYFFHPATQIRRPQSWKAADYVHAAKNGKVAAYIVTEPPLPPDAATAVDSPLFSWIPKSLRRASTRAH